MAGGKLADTCVYLKWRELHEPLTKGTINIHKWNYSGNIKDYFAKYPLNEITPEIIESWLLYLSGERKLKASTVNLQLRTLRMMFGEAMRRKLITVNPCNEVKEVKQEDTKRIILTVEEVKKLFPVNWSKIWETKIVYVAHLLGACNGVRIGELRGLKKENVFDNYISINGQYTPYGYSPNTKTKLNRNVPIAADMRQKLDELIKRNGDGYVFSENSGKSPIGIEKINRQYDKALENIGISREEKLERNLSFHAWRHFLNTLLRNSNVADAKVQQVTGHRTMKMTEHYTHFDTRQFTEVMDVQTNLLAINNAKKNIPAKAKSTAKQKTAGTTKNPVKKLPVAKKKRA